MKNVVRFLMNIPLASLRKQNRSLLNDGFRPTFLSTLLLSVALLVPPAHAAPPDLDQLLQEVRRQQQAMTQINREREAEFLSDHDQRKRLLADAKTTLETLENQADSLKSEYEANQQALAELEDKLQAQSGVLGEIVGTVRQAAGDLRADLKQSLVSAQYSGRATQLDPIADGKRLPTLKQLNTLWYLLQQEMTEAGKVVKFQTKVLDSAGVPRQAEVVRIGTFNALADGLYLRYLPETEGLMELPRQPEGRILSLAEAFMDASGDYAPVGLDPTRGALLDMLIQTPNVWERIQQGGLIGYIILALGAVGLLIVAVRLIYLFRAGRQVEKQLSDLENPRADNPLGRILENTLSAKTLDPENLEALLDETILREIPPLERGQPLVKLLTAVTPLLGLLGTVTGMIQTFQAISLFGTGDPKLMAGGISQALVTTMLGLAVAIPLLFLHSLLANRSRTIIQILEEQSAALVSQILEKRKAA
ncbi:MotA/TolQ/ExbB proton channel family protein [Methylohalobius crimeensis]|uniref:MotA/TolQ/ExbB proton channel family protein n=1 Tax=Methylohalobius crimeensis TaxID=244365 RepID=UPI0003B5BC3D|nr:MotA/TolQ/ExbB proton channel family protein [Methylohalobius crimeensis]